MVMVEAAGQLVCLFRDRLDYAFTPAFSRGRGVLFEPSFWPLKTEGIES
jgi:hypothetical protein